MKRLFFTVFTLIFLSANSQITGSFQGGGNASFGNCSLISFNVGADLKKECSRYAWTFSPSYRWSMRSPYGSNVLGLYEDETYVEASWSKPIGRGWKLIVFTEDERSFLRKIVLRSSLGVGVGQHVFNKGGFTITLSEVILPAYYWSEAKFTNNMEIRSSTRLKVAYESDKVTVSSVSLYQPAIFSERLVSYEDNLNIRSANSVTFKTSLKFSIGISHLLIYQSYPHYINPSVKLAENNFSLVMKYSL